MGYEGTNPVKMIQQLSKFDYRANEFMFRKGIGVEKFESLMCQSKYYRDEVLDMLAKAGVTEVNGKPVEDFVQIWEWITVKE